MQYFFTSDEHFDHKNILIHCDRPWDSVEEMNEGLIQRHNEVVGKNDVVVHAGDFTFKDEKPFLSRLNGTHIFIRGNHDGWLKRSFRQIWSKRIAGQYIVVCHYPMRVWKDSHYNSWQLHGHTHSWLKPCGKQWDVGVDNNNFYPVSFEELKKIMHNQPDNFDLVTKENPYHDMINETFCEVS